MQTLTLTCANICLCLLSGVYTECSAIVCFSAPVRQLYITSWNTSQVIPDRTSQLTFTEGVPGVFRCVAHGGYPAPDLQVIIGEIDVGSELSLSYSPVFDGIKGLRTMAVTVERVSNNFLARPEFDGQDALCMAVVPGMPANSTAVKICVNCECTFVDTSHLG